jgi:outer membrane beta-barrel protein
MKALSKVFNSVSIFCLFFTCSGVFAADADSSRLDSGDDEYNFNWLDLDKKIYVIQNRKYLKGGHPVVSAMGGVGFSNPYKTTYNLDPRFAYYINETWGLELFYIFTFNFDNSTLVALGKAAPNVMPAIRQIESLMGGMIHYVPWYAKINVFNHILYFDWYFGAGMASVNALVDQRRSAFVAPNYASQSLYAFMLSTGHEYHVTQNLLARIDATCAIYQAPVSGLTGDSTWYSNFNFGLGLGWKL